MPKIHRGICPDKACELVAIEVKRQVSQREAFRVVAEELGVSPNTVKSWAFRNKVGVTAPTKNNSTTSHGTESSAVIKLHALTFDSRRRQIIFELRETDAGQFLAVREFKIGENGKEKPTKNHFTMPAALIPQLQSALDQVSVMIQEKCSGEPGAYGSEPDSKETEEGDPPSGADTEDAKTNRHNDIGAETESSPAPADEAEDTIVEGKLIRCRDCRRYAPGLQLKDREMNGSCQPQTLSWNGELSQKPDKLHSCQNFSRQDQLTS
jgi:hypothetical protein